MMVIDHSNLLHILLVIHTFFASIRRMGMAKHRDLILQLPTAKEKLAEMTTSAS
jgi:hypothetical protein